MDQDSVHTPGAMGRPGEKPPRKGKTKAKGRRTRMRIAPDGSISVSHSMKDAGTWSLELADVSKDGTPKWIQLGKTGTFAGHPAGPFELNARVFADIIKNFRATANKRIPIDFEHASEQDPASGSIPVDGAPAQGWIVDLKVDGGDLFGLVEWGDKAKEYIRSGAYRFISPAIRFNSKDRVTGERIGARLTSAGLVNQPFLDGMKPLAAKDQAPGEAPRFDLSGRYLHSTHEYMPALRGALRLGELATPRECSDAFSRVCDWYDMADGEPAQGVDVPGYVGALRDALKAPMGMTWDELVEVVEALIDAAIDEHEERFHEGEAPASEASAEMRDTTTPAAVPPAPTPEENTIMGTEATKDNAAAVELGEVKIVNSKLTLQLSDEKTKRETAEAEVKTLLAWKAEREEADVKARVEEAFETYKDAKKLSDKEKPHMLSVAKAAPEAFDALYPKVKPSEKHLLRNLTGKGRDMPAILPGNAGAGFESLDETTRRIMKDEGLPYETAQNRAVSLRRNA